jgi:hypothetical protein
MLLTLPEPDPAHTAELTDARHAHSHTGVTLGRREAAAAARILRSLMGEQAARLLAFCDADELGTLTFTVLVVFGRDRELMWFNDYTNRYRECCDYPGASAVSDEDGDPLVRLDQAVVNAVEEHLERAYTAFDTPQPELHATNDDYFADDDWKLVEFILDEALAPATAPPAYGTS